VCFVEDVDVASDLSRIRYRGLGKSISMSLSDLLKTAALKQSHGAMAAVPLSLSFFLSICRIIFLNLDECHIQLFREVRMSSIILIRIMMFA